MPFWKTGAGARMCVGLPVSRPGPMGEKVRQATGGLGRVVEGQVGGGTGGMGWGEMEDRGAVGGPAQEGRRHDLALLPDTTSCPCPG